MQVQTPMDDEFDVGQSIPYHHGQFPRQDSASSALPAREAAAGFKGALKKVANGIAGDASLTISVNMMAECSPAQTAQTEHPFDKHTAVLSSPCYASFKCVTHCQSTLM